MKTKRLLWQIYPPLVTAIIFAMVATSWYASSSLHEFFLAQTVDNLEIRARFVLKQVRQPFFEGKQDLLNNLSRSLAREAATRITLILKSGEVVADSDEQATKMDNHADRSEIGQALAGRTGSSMRYSHTLRQNMLYVAIPIYGKDSVSVKPAPSGVLRLSIPVNSIDQALHQVYRKILFSSIFLIIIAALITLAVSRRISRPIEKIRQGAERFAQGDLSRKIVFGRDKTISAELVDLTAAMNKMAQQLAERIGTITGQKNELEAVFSSMVEAVLLIDMDERFIGANKAAISLLELGDTNLEGKSTVEVVRNPDLLKFIRKSLAVSFRVEEELIMRESGRELFFQAHGTSLEDANEERIGCLVVLHDLTRLRRLERIRSDFVANVSHELKTPITTIKGFVETLKDGALDDRVAAERFIEIILKNSNRLDAIVDDLLALSKIEEEDDNRQIELSAGSVKNVITDSVEACASRAAEKNLSIAVECPPDLEAEINSPLLQQAVVNLLVNAVKYSPPDGDIRVKVRSVGGSVIIQVEDFGVGIPKEHLPRLFERFYRSDKARSRGLGGTGLGLAIVKHIVHAHNGEVEVASTLAEGTVFTIKIPTA